ncbi:hypothetical protein MFIFM68171_03907 [Madurella fahalii]|uniref:Uncharacterized protein n=1 Tax=Madurella fahalii TaxID=1157608 RepID=A0ABQ0G7H1_9PEZI
MSRRSSSKSYLPQVVLPDETTILPGHPSSTASLVATSAETAQNSALPTSSTRSVSLQVSSPLPLPPTPYPWLWQCHKCSMVYQLGCTRRCLECSHEFCTTIRHEKSSRFRSGKKHKKTCRSEFDYIAWAAWGAFRRTAAIQADAATEKHTLASTTNGSTCETTRKRRKSRASGSSPTSRLSHDTFARWELAPEDDDDWDGTEALQSQKWRPLNDAEQKEITSLKEEMYIRREHNCWLHCDYPSECLHAIHGAWLRTGIPGTSEERTISRDHDNQPGQTRERERDSLAAGSAEYGNREVEVNGVDSNNQENTYHPEQHSIFELCVNSTDTYRDGEHGQIFGAPADTDFLSPWASSEEDDFCDMDFDAA